MSRVWGLPSSCFPGALLLSLFVYSVSWSPVLGVFGDRPYRMVLIAGLACPAAVFFGLWFHRAFPSWTTILRIPYWTLLAGCHLILIVFAIGMDPVYFFVSIGLSLSVLLFPKRRRWGGSMLILAVLLLTLVTAWDLRYHSMTSAIFFVILGLGGATATWWALRRGAFLPLSRIAIAFAVFGTLIYPRSFVLYRLAFPGYLPAVISQPGVRAVYAYADKKIRTQVPPQIMFMVRMPGSAIYVLGPQKPYDHLYILRAHDEPRVTSLGLGSRGSDNLALDPDDPTVLYMGAGNWFHKIWAVKPEILESIELDQSVQNKNFVHYDAKGDQFFISEDFGDQVFVVDRKTFHERATIESPPGTRTDDVWVDPVGDLVLVDSRYLVGRRVDTYDRRTLNHEKTYRWPWDHGFNFSTVDPKGRRAYLASGLTGRIRVLDLESLEPVYGFRLEIGIRNVNFDPRRRWLIIGNYFQGRLFAYDVERKKMIGHLFLGRRLRWVQVDRENGKWYVTSAVGGFEISPDEAFGPRRTTQ